MRYVEEKDLTIRLELRCEFPDDYDGDEDGYAWLADLPQITSEVVQAIVEIVRRRGTWSVRPANRGRPNDEEVTLILERAMAAQK